MSHFGDSPVNDTTGVEKWWIIRSQWQPKKDVENHVWTTCSLDIRLNCEDLSICSQRETMENQKGEEIQLMKDIPNEKSFLGDVLVQEDSVNVKA